MTENGHKPILDLEEDLPKREPFLFRTVEERKAGKKATQYEIRSPEEFSIEEEHEYRSRLSEYATLMAKPWDDLKKSDKAKRTQYLHYLCDSIVVAPDEIKAALSDRQRQNVIAVFQIALLTEDARAVESAMPTEMARRISSTTES